MTRFERRKHLSDFYKTLAVELESHVANGSDFLFMDNRGEEPAPEEVQTLRLQTLKSVVRLLENRAWRLSK